MPGQPAGYVKIIVSNVRMRSAANTDSDIVSRPDYGAVLPYYLAVKPSGDSYLWYYVKDGSVMGYLRSDCVRECTADGTIIDAPTAVPTGSGPTATPTPTAKPATPTPTPSGTVKGWVRVIYNTRLRSAPAIDDSNIITSVGVNNVLPYYNVVHPSNDSYSWYDVLYSGQRGYIRSDMVRLCNQDGTDITTPTPSAAPATPTPTPGTGSYAEYYTLGKSNTTGDAVTRLTTELKRQGYYTGAVTSSYTSAVTAAVKKFQSARGISADGIAWPSTQHALFGTQPYPSGNVDTLSMNIYVAEKIDWYTGGIQSLWPKGTDLKIYDVYTGIVWWAHRWSGSAHADIEPLAAADTVRLCRIYGVNTAEDIEKQNLWQRRPCLVTIGTRTFACSMYGVPHNPEGDTVSTNNFGGQVCLHFTNSKTHGSDRVDENHEATIQYAWQNAPNGHK